MSSIDIIRDLFFVGMCEKRRVIWKCGRFRWSTSTYHFVLLDYLRYTVNGPIFTLIDSWKSSSTSYPFSIKMGSAMEHNWRSRKFDKKNKPSFHDLLSTWPLTSRSWCQSPIMIGQERFIWQDLDSHLVGRLIFLLNQIVKLMQERRMSPNSP